MENKTDRTTPILITGAAGFIGKNLCARLEADGFTDLMLYDKDTDPALLPAYCARAAFVYHLAGVNRPTDKAEFYTGNTDFTTTLLAALADAGNLCPIAVTSSIQAELENDYGKSKRMAEDNIFAYARQTGATCFVFRLPGVFGKWCRPSYNSVVATFCYNAARGLPLEVRDPAYSLPLVYIDDVVDALLGALSGHVLRDRSLMGFCRVTPVYETTLGDLARTILSFPAARDTLAVADMNDGLTRSLYSTFLSYLPTDAFAYPLTMHKDNRGSFTEFLRTDGQGQVSVNISNPGIVKGNHWHDSKNEKFLVVSGKASIRFRKVGESDVTRYVVSGDDLQVVDIPTGYTHLIENIGDGPLVTVMWANLPFDPDAPDTHALAVDPE